MRASYPRAVQWLAYNDDCSWIDERDDCLSVAACLVCGLWDKSGRVLAADIVKFRERESRDGTR